MIHFVQTTTTTIKITLQDFSCIMDALRLDLLTLNDHLMYPENCISIEGDIQHLDLISNQFQSQSDHPDALGLAFEVRLLPDEGIGETRELYFDEICPFFKRRAQELSDTRFKFFFMVQPGASNRIWMPCMRLLLSILQVNPCFPQLVGTAHTSSFGSYIRRSNTERTPEIFETWWSISAPRTWPSDAPVIVELMRSDGFKKLFDVRLFEQNKWAVLIWRTSICMQYDLRNKTCTIVSLDEGGNFRKERFERAMMQRQELNMREDPFSVHVLFFSQTVQDWTFSFEVLQREVDKEQNKVFRNPLRMEEFEVISRRLHDLLAYQLKYQSHLASVKVMIEAMEKEHKRFQKLIGIPDHVYERVEDNLERLRIQAHSNYQHSLRMEKQTKNIQEQLLELTNLDIKSAISENTRNSVKIQQAINQNTESMERLVRGIEGLFDL